MPLFVPRVDLNGPFGEPIPQAGWGDAADWMHRVLGGLAPGAPGYRVLDVAPQPGGGIAWAKTAHLTP